MCVLVTKQKLCDGVALVCSLPKPHYRLGIVLRHAPAIPIQDPEIGLGQGVALLRSFLKPYCCRSTILLHAATNNIH